MMMSKKVVVVVVVVVAAAVVVLQISPPPNTSNYSTMRLSISIISPIAKGETGKSSQLCSTILLRYTAG